MGSQISEGLVFGGFSYDLAFPFAKNRKMSKEMVLKDLERILSEKGIKTALMVLGSKEYNCFHKAVNIIEKKFLFYKNLLESEELRNKHIDALGAGNLALRIFFAMHGCVNHANNILQAMEEEVKELVPNVNLALDNPNWWTVSNINEPKTPCVKTGVCICERGQEEPYVQSCLHGDPSSILLSDEKIKERQNKFIDLFVKMIKGRK